MKFLIRLPISIFLLAAFFLKAGSAHAAVFKDVGLNYKHQQAIVALADRGIIKGYTDNTFRPDQTINRAEALKILVESRFEPQMIAGALNEHRSKKHTYVNVPDVLMNDWFGPYVELGFKHNITKGYPDKTFKPAQSINFAEGLKMILRTYGVDAAQTKTLDWFMPYLDYAHAHNLINPNKFYHPSQFMTRGEFAEIIFRLEMVKTNDMTSFSWDSKTSNEYTITIPALNIINQKVDFADPYNAEGALELLRRSPLGHYLATPGSGKKFVLYGHSSGYAWDKSPYKVVLRRINELKEGDAIYINYHEKGYGYRIFKSEIIPEHLDNQIMMNEEANEMALYTCWPPDSTRYRYVVYGKPMNVENYKIVLNK